jgi:hypothetical protein
MRPLPTMMIAITAAMMASTHEFMSMACSKEMAGAWRGSAGQGSVSSSAVFAGRGAWQPGAHQGA